MSKIESIIMLLVAAHLSAEIVHELGHLLAARYFGVRVLRISVGLGPKNRRNVRPSWDPLVTWVDPPRKLYKFRRRKMSNLGYHRNLARCN